MYETKSTFNKPMRFKMMILFLEENILGGKRKNCLFNCIFSLSHKFTQMSSVDTCCIYLKYNKYPLCILLSRLV